MNWPQRRLDEIADVFGGGTPSRTEPKYWGGECPWITPTDLPMPGQGIAEVATAAEHITEAGVKESAATPVPPGTVLFSSRATIGKIGIASVPLTTNQGFCNFVPKPGVESKFLAFALLHETDSIAQLAGSTTFKEVTRGNLRSYRIPVPAPREQRRIVELLEQADALRRQRTETDALAARILPALFRKTFGDPVANTNHWPRMKLDDIGEWASGGTPSRSNPSYFEGDIEWYSAGELNSLYLPASKERISAKAIAESAAKIFKMGSLLVGMYDTAAFKMGILTKDASSNQACANVLPDSTVCVVEWLYVNLLQMKDHFLRHRRGIRQQNLSLAMIRGFEIPVPPLPLQTRFAEQVKSVDRIGIQQGENRQRLENLFQGMLHRAFTGELTARWREEHMKELLAEMEQQARSLNTNGGTP